MIKHSFQANDSTVQNQLAEGLVVSHLGKALAIESASGEIIICHTRRQLGTAAVGDRVSWEKTGTDQGRVVAILPRRSLLSRPGRNGKTKPFAANLDQIFVVFTVKPDCDFLLIDQFLVSCEHHSIRAGLVFNKIDLFSPTESIRSQISIYEKLGYSIYNTSAKTGEGINQFRNKLGSHVSMLVGQSGGGKSSLTNALLPDKALRVAALSKSTDRGRHTTTTATLYHLPSGGELIDSPGLAIFGLAEISEGQLAQGYIEFRQYIEQCKFNDCRHIDDKGCAIKSAIEAGEIYPERYQRFLKLREKLLFMR